MVLRQLDRLEDRTKDLATKADLQELRKEVVARESFEAQMNALRSQTERVNADRIEDKRAMEERIKQLETEQLSRQDRLWQRLTQIAGVAGLILALFEFLTHLRFSP